MKSYSSALMLIAAAIFWNGAAVFFNGHKIWSYELGIGSICFACLLILMALFKWGQDV